MALVRACVSLLLIALFYNYATVQVSADSAIDEVILDAANSNRDFQDSSHEVVETDEQRQALQRLSQSGESQREKKQVAGHRFRRWLHGGISFGLQIHNCLDQNEQCPYWAGIGECGKDHNYMYTNCKKSCKVCDSQPPNPAIFELPNPVVIEPPNPAVFELPNPVVIEPPNPVVFGHCLDQNEKCSYWAFIGECAKNPIYMHSNCKKSCWLCGSTNSDLVGFEHCLDQNEKCSHWANNGECDKNPIYMHSYCKNSCQLCDSQPLNPGVVEPCIDNNAKCAHWAKSGECDINPVYMLTNCKSSCSACKLNW
uniref:ShKT domain-containing protein n=1 Tax=Octopus bimaculoides TaxID=37653 RepID=A0A0L8HE40_OCTBM